MTQPVYLQETFLASLMGGWAHFSILLFFRRGQQKLPIEFLVDCLVGRYAMPVVYYVSGWMLYSASKASTLAAEDRPVCFMFVASHTIDERVAKSTNLPTSLVERRKWQALVFCTRGYINFICCIESIFLPI
jgi:hypothetical protein